MTQEEPQTPVEQLQGKLILTMLEATETCRYIFTPEVKSQAQRLLAFANELVAAMETTTA